MTRALGYQVGWAFLARRDSLRIGHAGRGVAICKTLAVGR